MDTRRRLLQYSDAERQWLLAEDGNVERRLSASGLRNAAVWRTTETFSGEPFTQGMMDAPDTALGMDLAYLVRFSGGGRGVEASRVAAGRVGAAARTGAARPSTFPTDFTTVFLGRDFVSGSTYRRLWPVPH